MVIIVGFRRTIRRLLQRIHSRGLSKVGRQVKSDGLTFLSLERLLYLEREAKGAIARCSGGDILEFGIALGGSSIVLATIASSEHPYHGFDVFGMIPAPDSEKDDERSKARYAVIAKGRAKGFADNQYYGYRQDLYADVCKTFARYGVPVDGERVSLYKGLFEDTWPAYRGSTVAFAHVDCDWYDPTRFCLESISDRMLPGGVVVVDDYHEYAGSQRAVDEFLSQNSHAWKVSKQPSLVMRKI